MSDGDIYEPHDRLLTVKILGKVARVPENNVLLRCYQFVAPDEVPYGDFCWNGDCHNCRCTLKREGAEEEALSCQTVVKENDEIVEASPELRRVLLRWSKR
jgi:hypothetical protein